jgi:hypothetical protein
MMVHNDLKQLPEFKNAVITIGSFDGVHCGHQKIIQRVKELAQKVDGESVLITFHPHPRLVIYPKDRSLQLLTTIDEKVRLLERYGLDHVVVVPFSIEFSQQSADEYIVNFLVDRFHPKYIVIGYDHKFGLNRQGDIDFLRHYQKSHHYEVEEIPAQEIDDLSISSTKIRKGIQQAQIQAANKLLGHYYTLTGTVVHGQQIGETLGFPTANLEVTHTHKLIPPNGIYAVRVRHHNQVYGGMLYIGDRPTLKNLHNRTIEVNIFEFKKNIYGDRLLIEFVDYVRADEAFSNLADLSVQLGKDKTAAEAILNQSVQEVMEEAPKVQASVAVVILNYNGEAYLKSFLPSVLASEYQNIEIIVADNGSTDDSIAFLKEAFPDIRILELKENSGFAEGYNRALQQVEADYYVLLNSDVEVTPNWIDPIIELMERDKTIAACQPKIMSYADKAFFEYAGASGGWMDFLGYPFCRGRIFAVTEFDEGQYDDTQEIFWASGAAMFVRGKLFHRIGGFDPDYFAHAEEIDLCWRLKRAGYKIMVRPKSVVYHVGGGTLSYTTPRKTYLNFRNSLFTILKNEPLKKLYWLLPLRLLMDGLAGGLFLAQGRIQHIRAIVSAHWSFFGNFSRFYRKRAVYQDLIDQVSIDAQPNLKAQYPASIVWKYYAQKKRFFKQL